MKQKDPSRNRKKSKKYKKKLPMNNPKSKHKTEMVDYVIQGKTQNKEALLIKPKLVR